MRFGLGSLLYWSQSDLGSPLNCARGVLFLVSSILDLHLVMRPRLGLDLARMQPRGAVRGRGEGHHHCLWSHRCH